MPNSLPSSPFSYVCKCACTDIFSSTLLIGFLSRMFSLNYCEAEVTRKVKERISLANILNVFDLCDF